MIIGLPKEVKEDEYRVAITPGGVKQLVAAGHEVLVEEDAGAGSGFSKDNYTWAGARLVPKAEDAWGADLVAKVKEPQPSEYGFLRHGLGLFTYLHLAAEKELTLELLERGVIGIAYETVECPEGTLPLLTPMSEIAGRMAVQVGGIKLASGCGRSGLGTSGRTWSRPGPSWAASLRTRSRAWSRRASSRCGPSFLPSGTLASGRRTHRPERQVRPALQVLLGKHGPPSVPWALAVSGPGLPSLGWYPSSTQPATTVTSARDTTSGISSRIRELVWWS